MGDGGGDGAAIRIVQFDLNKLSRRANGTDGDRKRFKGRFAGQADFMRPRVIVHPIDAQGVDEAKKIADER